MDMTAVKDEIRLQLTGDILELELSDTSLTKIINASLRELQRYIDTVALITIPFKKCIDLSNYKISSITGVKRAAGLMSDGETIGSDIVDPLYVSQWQIMTGVGNVGMMTDYAYNYAAWNTILQIKNTTSTDLSFWFDKPSNKLYINISSNIPEKVTIVYVPRFDDVSQITSDYWIDVLIRLAIAHSKIVVGRVRSKFKQPNAPWSLDGDQLLSEGTTELNDLREKLQENAQLVYGLD